MWWLTAPPFELAPDAALHPGHDAAHVIGEFELVTVIGGDDDAELVALAVARLVERLGSQGPLGAIE